MMFCNFFYVLLRKIPSMVLGCVKGNGVKVTWSRVKSQRNFGDDLAPHIMKYYGLTPINTYYNKSDVLLVGSVLEWISQDFSGYILGVGCRHSNCLKFPNAKILSVRGELTLRSMVINDKNGITIGDPGLLMSLVFPQCQKPICKLGIIPHFVNWSHPIINKWRASFERNDVLFINPRSSVPEVVEQIKSCQYIISSSLHGLIVADSFHIPNMRFIINEENQAISDFKFEDYYSAIKEKNSFVFVTGEETVDYLVNSCSLKKVLEVETVKKNLDFEMKAISSKFRTK